MFTLEQCVLAQTVLQQCRDRRLILATAESCTGGLLSGLLTEIPGGSDIFTQGFVTYSNAAKQSMLGVPAELLKCVGAVSAEAARAMAEGALRAAGAAIAVSVTGIAGPGGGTARKPVGTVYLACARAGYETIHERRPFSGDRHAVRTQALVAALELVQRQLCR